VAHTEGGQQERLAQAPDLGRPKYTLKIIINKQEYRKFRLIKSFTFYSCPSIYIRLNCLSDTKSDLKIFIKYAYIFISSEVGWWAPSFVTGPGFT
jgi:hypothetical protein